MNVLDPYLPPDLRSQTPGLPNQPLLAPRPPAWLKGVLAFTGACTPGGFLFLIALLAEVNIRFPIYVWMILAALGGAAGWFLASKAVQT